jgi:hypothetical protein
MSPLIAIEAMWLALQGRVPGICALLDAADEAVTLAKGQLDAMKAAPASPVPSSAPGPTEKTTAGSSVLLDPATCLALKPIHDIGNQAMKERDAWNEWSVGIARMLNVSCSDFSSDVVADEYAELRSRITLAIRERRDA